MSLTRRQLLARGGAAAFAAPGIYALLDGIATAPARAATLAGLTPEQHLMQGIQVITDNGLEVIVPPLHHQVVTASLPKGMSRSDLQSAQQALESAISGVERSFQPTPSGLGVTVGWGRSYFHRYARNLRGRRSFADFVPVDNRASQANGSTVSAFLDAIRFPSDPDSTILEDNDVVLLLRSDSLDNIAAGYDAIVGRFDDLIEVTSIRRGFVGGGFGGKRSLPKAMAMAAGVPGAESIPETSELFMGFTSTQKKALGPPLIANFETIPGLTDAYPSGYFAHGTTMHLSHLFIDLAAWYGRDFSDRVHATFRPSTDVPAGTQTVPEGPEAVEGAADVASDQSKYGRIGHSGSIQPATRLGGDVTDNYGTFNPKGTAIPQRADFNTLDNPFHYTSRPDVDKSSGDAAAGLHFLVFAPTSDAFHRGRLAMDGRYGTTTVGSDPHAAGFNSVLTTTHRQNYLIPPRAHRSFPLAELV